MVDDVKALLLEAEQAPLTAERAAEVFRLLDLTNLNDEDGLDAILSLCDQGKSPAGHVAAVCIYPRFVKAVRQYLRDSVIKIATVANFPAGCGSAESVINEIEQALRSGADEIDVVFPYHVFLTGDEEYPFDFIQACKSACADHPLKVILETGALVDVDLISDATALSIEAGADFIKTSTGKLNHGATLEAAIAILEVIQHQQKTSGRTIGIKISGGIRTLQQAVAYLTIAEEFLGQKHLNSNQIRFGASSLLFDIFHYF